jgi:hypothetical protein
MKIMSSQQGSRAICILSATGTISNVTLRQSTSSGGTLTYEVSSISCYLHRKERVPSFVALSYDSYWIVCTVMPSLGFYAAPFVMFYVLMY